MRRWKEIYISLALSFSDSRLLPLPQILRAEEEKKLTEQKKAEEERKLREESERKQKEQEEKRKRLEEAEKKRQAMMKGSSVSCKTLFVRFFSGWKEEREKGLQEVPVMSAALPDTTQSKFDLLDRRYYEGAPALFVSTLDIILLLNMLLDCHYICLRCLNYIIFLSHFKVDPHSLP